MSVIDLRSDTFTLPSTQMRQILAEAKVGDDVYDEDPSIKHLEEYVSDLFKMESSLFVPSGTMANLIALGTHAGPGDEAMFARGSHVHAHEAGGMSRFFGISAQPIDCMNHLLTLADLKPMLRPNDFHCPRTRLIVLENPHNRAGGLVHSMDSIAEISTWARQQGLVMHLDGARLMNAVVATGIEASTWTSYFDSVSMCFSKGLGAPVGSVLSGSKPFIEKAKRLRKALGGGMRQSGILAAAAEFALKNNLGKLAEDHANAQLIGASIKASKHLSLESPRIETNMVWVKVDQNFASAQSVADQLRSKNILVSVVEEQVFRIVTHLDISEQQAKTVAMELLKLDDALVTV